MIVQDPSVTLTVNCKLAGVTTTKPNHVKVSSTVPYNVTVKASSSVLSSSGAYKYLLGNS
ncbi:hypothetical protein CS542_03420 [Pedobacter sp. IW39]|nr:hypothetical protein CS542_03420 [Pedobacter sp. IW39]